jgi:hypothetical protein
VERFVTQRDELASGVSGLLQSAYSAALRAPLGYALGNRSARPAR